MDPSLNTELNASSCSSSSSSAIRALQMELKRLQASPVEGFTVTCDDENIFKWTVAIFGPPGTIYQGGYFKAQLSFPDNYPSSPPTIRFLTDILHPNIYEDGNVCLSLLDQPVDDLHSGELPSERWSPIQNVRNILLSVISLLCEPQTSVPANMDASANYLKWKDAGETENEYAKIIRNQVISSKKGAEKDNITVPETDEEYREFYSNLEQKNKVADEKTKEEMMEQLKKLGDMCLRPFGLSTNNFQMVPQPGGGFSIQMKK
uniref:UBC core domain-containing protein n=1 Tax=Ditylenchus dipsaci TaxID=166011 RepID=A0A915DXE1_9BILA